MQTEDIEIEFPAPCLNTLDSALQRLGMLATSTNSSREYRRELYKKPYLKMVQINTRYVSNVSIGFRVRPLTPHVRYKPYTIRERHRTRSENDNDKDTTAFIETLVDNVIQTSEELSQLKKAKSLESIIAEGGDTNKVNLSDITIGNCPELEVVSNSIQNLRVAE